MGFPSSSLLACCCYLLFVGSSSLTFDDCGSTAGAFSSIKLTSCDPDTMDYCPLKKGKNVTIELTFKPNEEVTKVDVDVYGYIVGVPVPFLLPNPNGCVDSGLTCPIPKDVEQVYTLTLPIRSVYPKLKVDIKVELKDQNKSDVVCVMIPAKII